MLTSLLVSCVLAAPPDPEALVGRWRFDWLRIGTDDRFAHLRTDRDFAIGAAYLTLFMFEFSRGEDGALKLSLFPPAEMEGNGVRVTDEGFEITAFGNTSHSTLMDDGELLVAESNGKLGAPYYRVFDPNGELGPCWTLTTERLEQHEWWRLLPEGQRPALDETSVRIVLTDEGRAVVHEPESTWEARLVATRADEDGHRRFDLEGTGASLRLNADGRGILRTTSRTWPIERRDGRDLLIGSWRLDIERARASPWMRGFHADMEAQLQAVADSPQGRHVIGEGLFAVEGECVPIGANSFGVVSTYPGATSRMIMREYRILDVDRMDMIQQGPPIPFVRTASKTEAPVDPALLPDPSAFVGRWRADIRGMAEDVRWGGQAQRALTFGSWYEIEEPKPGVVTLRAMPSQGFTGATLEPVAGGFTVNVHGFQLNLRLVDDDADRLLFEGPDMVGGGFATLLHRVFDPKSEIGGVWSSADERTRLVIDEHGDAQVHSGTATIAGRLEPVPDADGVRRFTIDYENPVWKDSALVLSPDGSGTLQLAGKTIAIQRRDLTELLQGTWRYDAARGEELTWIDALDGGRDKQFDHISRRFPGARLWITADDLGKSKIIPAAANRLAQLGYGDSISVEYRFTDLNHMDVIENGVPYPCIRVD